MLLWPYCSTMPGVVCLWQTTHSSVLSARALTRSVSAVDDDVDCPMVIITKASPNTKMTTTRPMIRTRVVLTKLFESLDVSVDNVAPPQD
jgi:hypothetical protein